MKRQLKHILLLTTLIFGVVIFGTQAQSVFASSSSPNILTPNYIPLELSIDPPFTTIPAYGSVTWDAGIANGSGTYILTVSFGDTCGYTGGGYANGSNYVGHPFNCRQYPQYYQSWSISGYHGPASASSEVDVK